MKFSYYDVPLVHTLSPLSLPFPAASPTLTARKDSPDLHKFTANERISVYNFLQDTSNELIHRDLTSERDKIVLIPRVALTSATV